MTIAKSQAPEIVEIDITSQTYPEQLSRILKNKAPKFIYAQGNLDLLNSNGIGFCGSRKSSEKGLETARDCAQQSAENNITVISGNAAGVDFEAHYSALSSGGSTILVLPEGINRFRVKKALSSVWDWDRTLVVSQFSPDDSWKAYRAMTRNLVIMALSKAMIVIEAGEKGGTINAGLETLKYNQPLFVAEYMEMTQDAAGNRKLLGLGANRLARSQSTGIANMRKIFTIMENPPKNPALTDQIGLI